MATVASQRANWEQYTMDAQELSSWGYPTTADVAVLKGPNHSLHKIMYAGLPSTLFTAAPIGSEHNNMTAGTLLTKRDTSNTWLAP